MTIRILAAALCVSGVLTGSASYAAAASDASGLDEIVVTAERREESAQNVGIALSVISGDSLAQKGITHVDDLQNALPSIQVEPAFGSGLPQYRIRGVGFLDYTSNNASPVGVSLDDVAYALPIQSQGQLFDIDRVEVLRGPQGTLYGRNTTISSPIVPRRIFTPASRPSTVRTMSFSARPSFPARLPKI